MTDMAVSSPIPGARFVDPGGPRAHRQPRAGGASRWSTALINGTHRSPFFGASVDFAEHRGYVSGDDIRRVDWRVYARTDKYYIKEFEADSNANFSVLLDVSKSMSFGEKISKLDYAKTLAALPDLPGQPAARSRRPRHLRRRHRRPRAAVGEAPRRRAAHARSREGDTPGTARPAAAQARRALRPPRHHRGDLRFLRRARRDLRGRRSDPLPRQRRRAVPRARSARDRLRRSSSRRASKTSRAATRFRSCPTSWPTQYRALITAHIETLAKRASEQQMDYMLLNTAMPLDFALFRFLSMRERLASRR